MTTSTGLMLPTSSLDLASQWECLGVGGRGSGCGAVMEADAVVRLEERVAGAEVPGEQVEVMEVILQEIF